MERPIITILVRVGWIYCFSFEICGLYFEIWEKEGKCVLYCATNDIVRLQYDFVEINKKVGSLN